MVFYGALDKINHTIAALFVADYWYYIVLYCTIFYTLLFLGASFSGKEGRGKGKSPSTFGSGSGIDPETNSSE